MSNAFPFTHIHIHQMFTNIPSICSTWIINTHLISLIQAVSYFTSNIQLPFPQTEILLSMDLILQFKTKSGSIVTKTFINTE